MDSIYLNSIFQIIIFCLIIRFSVNRNSCINKKVGIYDTVKFPNSRFSHHLPHDQHKPYSIRIFDNITFHAWLSTQTGNSWVQVDLGLKKENKYFP